VRSATLSPGRPVPAALAGAILARDLQVDGDRWSKGRRLSPADLERLASGEVRAVGMGRSSDAVSVLVLEPGDLHEDEAALRLASAVMGEGACLTVRGPAESRVDLLAEADGVVSIRLSALQRLNSLDPLEVFTLFDGQIVRRGDLVASVKVAPHVVAEAVVERGEAIARRGGPLVRVRPFLPLRVGVLVKETVTGAARERFEASVRSKLEGLGARQVGIRYVADDVEAVAAALRSFTRGRQRADLVLTAGGASTDPADPFFVALEELGGRVVRRGVPAHPGSMLWLGRLGRTSLLGLPTCGAYSKATAADLLLPRLMTGEPASAATVARLGHGGILTRSMRFRFPPYARELDAPEG
jgi:hypothetical protein